MSQVPSEGLPALIRAGENQAGDPKPVEAQPSQAQVFCLLPSTLEVSTVLCIQGLTSWKTEA